MLDPAIEREINQLRESEKARTVAALEHERTVHAADADRVAEIDEQLAVHAKGKRASK